MALCNDGGIPSLAWTTVGANSLPAMSEIADNPKSPSWIIGTAPDGSGVVRDTSRY